MSIQPHYLQLEIQENYYRLEEGAKKTGSVLETLRKIEDVVTKRLSSYYEGDDNLVERATEIRDGHKQKVAAMNKYARCFYLLFGGRKKERKIDEVYGRIRQRAEKGESEMVPLQKRGNGSAVGKEVEEGEIVLAEEKKPGKEEMHPVVLKAIEAQRQMKEAGRREEIFVLRADKPGKELGKFIKNAIREVELFEELSYLEEARKAAERAKNGLLRAQKELNSMHRQEPCDMKSGPIGQRYADKLRNSNKASLERETQRAKQEFETFTARLREASKKTQVITGMQEANERLRGHLQSPIG